MTDKRTCAVPGCDTVLRPINVSGLCQKHPHVAPWCKCAGCAAGQISMQKVPIEAIRNAAAAGMTMTQAAAHLRVSSRYLRQRATRDHVVFAERKHRPTTGAQVPRPDRPKPWLHFDNPGEAGLMARQAALDNAAMRRHWGGGL